MSRNRPFPFLTWIAGFLLAGALTSESSAQSTTPRLQSGFDAFCGVPRLRIPLAPGAEQTSILEASDDLFGADWQPLLHLGPGDGHHDFHDAEGRSRTRRFYRMRRVSRPPLQPVDNFRLTDHLGQSHELYREGDARGVVLVFTSLATLAKDWEPLRPLVAQGATNGLLYWMIAPATPRAELARAVTATGITIPVLDDDSRVVTRVYGAIRTGEAVAIDGATATVFYRGAVTVDIEPLLAGDPAVHSTPLADAVELYLSERPPRVEFVRGAAPALDLPALAVPDYRSTIAPLIQAKCQTCHRVGDIGTFAITEHRSIAERLPSIRANLLEGLMPPWHADRAHSRFSNDMGLTPSELESLVAWIDAGAPRGDATQADPLAEPAGTPGSWPLGTPDLVLRIPRQNIPASGTVPYAYLFVTNTLPTNTWIRAAAVRPGNAAVVHHALIFQVTPGNLLQMLAQVQEIQGGLAGYFAAYVPGMKQAFYPPDTAKSLKGRSILVFQMHYTPYGTATTDQSEIGLYLQSTPPRSELKTSAGYNTSIDIAPGQKDYRTTAERVFTAAVDIRELSPHMHYRGNSMRFDAILPDGTVRTLMNIPKYDFAWQAVYRLEEPVRLPAGSRLRLEGTFDNSRWNPFNPNPAARVRFGEQTGDEMFIGYINYTDAP